MYEVPLCNNVLNKMKTVFFLSKIFGVSPVTITGAESAEEYVEIKRSPNFTSYIYPVILFIAMLSGLVHSIVECIIFDAHDAGQMMHNAVCNPMTYLAASVSILTNWTTNRLKISKLLEEILSINKAIVRKKRNFLTDFKKCNGYSSVVLVILFFVLLVFLCCDIFISGRDYFMYAFGANLRLAHLVNFMIVVQFCKFVSYIKSALRELTQMISVNVDESAVFCDVRCVLNSEHPLMKRQISRNMPAVNAKFNNHVTPFHTGLGTLHRKGQETILINDIIFCRHMYNCIYDASALVNCIYGIPVLLEFIRNATFSITDVHYILKSSNFPTLPFFNKVGSLVVKLCWLFLYISTVFYMTASCHLVNLESNKLIDNIQKALLLRTLQKDSLKQLKLFSNQISNNRIQFTAFWFFTVDMSLFCAFLASSITYTIVLVQFK
jgi:hypothetical protein